MSQYNKQEITAAALKLKEDHKREAWATFPPMEAITINSLAKFIAGNQNLTNDGIRLLSKHLTEIADYSDKYQCDQTEDHQESQSTPPPNGVPEGKNPITPPPVKIKRGPIATP